MKKLWKKFTPISVINTLALMMVMSNINAACNWLIYQPKLPDSAKKFMKD